MEERQAAFPAVLILIIQKQTPTPIFWENTQKELTEHELSTAKGKRLADCGDRIT